MSEEKQGAPAWMVSFGDMMTLILTFFILLVSMSKEQQIGLVAKGIGSFTIALRSFGMPGILDESEEASIFENVRRRFNLPPEEDADRRTEHVDASNLELIRAKALKALQPHGELNQPAIATFEHGSSELSKSSMRYIDLTRTTLLPSVGQVLLLEGHAGAAEPQGRWLAYQRARAVAQYLVEEHDFPTGRVQARAWVMEVEKDGVSTKSVDARLILPERESGAED